MCVYNTWSPWKRTSQISCCGDYNWTRAPTAGSRIHHCTFAEMLTMSFSQLMTKKGRITKACPFLKDAGLLWQATLVQGLCSLACLKFSKNWCILDSSNPTVLPALLPSLLPSQGSVLHHCLIVLSASFRFFPFFTHRHFHNKFPGN